MGIKLQSIVPIFDGAPKIDYDSRVLLMGSCFSESMGEKLQYYKFDVRTNPFGVIFNPCSLENLVSRAVSDQPFVVDDVFEHQGLWKSFEVHSHWSHSDRAQLVQMLNEQRTQFREYLQKTTHLVFTFGTAWVYRHIESKSLVANCQKVPAEQFTKELLTVEDLLGSMHVMVSKIRQVNPNLRIVFTLSPVRHLKDGFIENNQSKARLFDAIQQFCDSDSEIAYFPSFEIVMDELRDYRFYKKDLVHPNELAIDYIWEKFQSAWLHPSALPIMDKVAKIRKALAHKPFYPGQASYREFEEQLSTKIKELQQLLPGIQFDS